MTPVLGGGIARRLRDILLTLHDDPLSLRQGGDIPHDAIAAVNHALDGLDRGRAERLATLLAIRYAVRLGIDPPEGWGDHRLRDSGAVDIVTASLLVHHGIDPLVTAWIAHDARTAEIIDPDTDEVAASVCSRFAPGRANNETVVSLGGNAFWYGTGHAGVIGLPSTVAASCVGRRLADVVSHPVLDGFALVVEDVEEHDDIVCLRVDADMRALSPQDLLRLSPCGCR